MDNNLNIAVKEVLYTVGVFVPACVTDDDGFQLS